LGSLTEIQNNLDLIHDETSSASMPPAELGYKALDACNQAVLDQWLSMGAPETTTLQVKSIPACSVMTTPIDIPIEKSSLNYDWTNAKIQRLYNLLT
jgi:hypothetical protein